MRKKIITRISTMVLGTAFIFGGIIGFSACKGNTEESSSQASYDSEYSLSLNKSFAEIELFGEGIQLQVRTVKDYIETDGTPTWESLNPDIVVVDQQGNVQPIAVGEGKVVAKWEGVEAECTIVVKSVSIPVLKTNQSSIGFIYGVSSAYALDAWVLYKDVEYRNDVQFSYSIPESGQQVATVDSNGIVTPVGIGETELTVTANYKNYNAVGMTLKIPVHVSYDVEVKLSLVENAAEELYVKKVEYDGSVYENQTALVYQVNEMEAGGMVEVSDAVVVWKSSDETVLSVVNGEVTAVGDGTASVWCEYTYEGYVCTSNEIEITVNPYAVVETLDMRVFLDKSNPSKVPMSTAIFGQEFVGEITSIVIGDNNLYEEGKINAKAYEDGYYSIEIANDEGYAYVVNGIVVSVSVEEEGVSFGLMQGEKAQTERYYNWALPTQQDIKGLMDQGYRSLRVGYRYTTSKTETVSITAKYESELNHEVETNINQALSFDLNILLDRYSELDEFSRSEYAFKVSEDDGKLTLNSCHLSNISADTYNDFKIDRNFDVRGYTVIKDVVKDDVKAPVSAVITASETKRAIVSSTNGISKVALGYLLNDGYNAYTVKYYLEYDATKMTKQAFAYAAENYGSVEPRPIISEKQSLMANQWAEITLPLDVYYVTRSLFDLEVQAADDGSEMSYTLYIASIKAVKVDSGEQAIRMYAGYPVEMWTSTATPKGINEYNKQIGDKTAYFYTAIDVQSTWQWGCFINFFTSLNVNAAKLQELKEDGYTTLDFEIYAKRSDGKEISLLLNPENAAAYSEQHKYTLKSDGWTTVSIDLDLLITYYERMNGCKGGYEFWKINPSQLTEVANIIYEIGVGAITPGGRA